MHVLYCSMQEQFYEISMNLVVELKRVFLKFQNACIIFPDIQDRMHMGNNYFMGK